ncbi:MAG TPA: HAMP domain-containing sensor histidine kinase [Gemmatimonadaceae bacterium]|nr:HAMP domain-containing sensor histidine kinase [Gemmatimonadaceae bacterium]
MKVPAQLREHRNAALMVAILAFMLLAVGVLTHQAWRTARTHERAVNTALQGYATFAAALYRERLEALTFTSLSPMRVFASNRVGDRARAFPSARTLHDSVMAVVNCRCRTVLQPNYVFRVDLASGEFESAGDSVPYEVQRWIVASLPASLKDYQRTQTYGSVVGPANGAERVVYFSARRNARGDVTAVYGMEPARASMDSSVFEEGLDEAMLQGVVLDDSIPNDSLVTVRAFFKSGTLRFASRNGFTSPHVGKEKLSEQGGGFALTATLNPAIVGRLVVGGMPKSQLPLLLGLMVLTLALVAAAIVLTWRTWTLARMRADFTSSVSHDLRTPVTQILLFAETISLGRLRTVAECRREARVIAEEGRRLLDLIENVLHFARSERYELPINRRLTNLSVLVRDVVDTFEPMAAAVGVSLRATIEEDVGARIDAPALQRCLRNVLDNALKYAHAGKEASVGLVLMGSRASVWVDDRGPGIPSADRQRIWQAFVRLDRDMNQATGGSGIGLAVVRDIIVRHGGVVRVEDAPGGGARFVMELPEACRLGPRAVEDAAPRDDTYRVGEG